MNRFLSLFYIFIFCFTCFGQENTLKIKANYPSLEEVTSHLNNLITNPIENHYYFLAKKPDGVYLNVTNYYKFKTTIVESFKVWDLNDKVYLDFDASHYFSVEKGSPKMWIQRLKYTSKNFNFYLFTGYPEWSLDTKQFLKNKNILTNYETELLARTYSAEASACIHPQSTFDLISFASEFEPSSYSKVKKKRIKLFQKYADSSLFYWKLLLDKSPDYKTHLIPDVRTKYSNECMFFWSILNSAHEEKLALKYLNQAEYSKSTINHTKSYLDACKSNAILITHGDTDTYSLWFLQEKENYRNDISVINSSLLYTDWYVKMQYADPTIKHQITKNQLMLFQQMPYMGMMNSDTLSFTETLQNALTIIEEGELEEGTYASISSSFFLNIKGNDELITPAASYLSGPTLQHLDLINSNPDRPFYSTYPYLMMDLGFQDMVASRLIVFELDPKGDIRGLLMDDLTVSTIEKYVEDFDLEETLKKTFFERNAFKVSMNLIADMSRTYPEKQMPLVEALLKKLSFETIIATNDYSLIISLHDFLNKTKPELVPHFKEYLIKNASDFITGLTWKDLQNEEMFNNLVQLLSIYKFNQVMINDYATPNFNDAGEFVPEELTESESTSIFDRELGRLAESKFKQLIRQPSALDYLWTFERLEDLMKVAK